MTRIESDDNESAQFSRNVEKKIQRKQKRFQHMIANDAGVVCCDEPTRVSFERREHFPSFL